MPQVPSAGALGATAPPPPAAQLLCRFGPGAPLRFRLTETRIIGSDPAAGVPVPMAGVSRHHLRLEYENGSWWVEDLQSSNGTFLNGRLVARDRLRHLDVIGVGRALEILFLLREEAPRLLRSRGIVHAALVAERGTDAVRPVALGETTIGRSSTCTIVVDDSPVSKVHARLERTSQQLLVRDLSSANGTYVNGHPITMAALRDGDELSLAGVATFRVVIEDGEVVTDPGMRVPVLPPEPDAPAFSMDWKTRYDWDENEMQQLADLQQELRARDVQKKARKAPEPGPPGPAPRPKELPAAKPAIPAPPLEAKPAVVVKPAAEAQPQAGFVEEPKPPARRPSAPAAPPAVEEEPPPTLLPARMRRVKRVVLVGETEELAAAEPGSYDIGRATDARLRPTHATVSRRHARLTISADGAKATLEDIGGRAGTSVNDVPVVGPVELKDGDVVRFGEATFKVRIEVP
jgi:pSer/pThr/pTyr-binding forkhead associated (FHA) protein